MSDLLKVIVGDGKYTVIQNSKGELNVLRHNSKWRECSGDNLILTLAQEVETLRTQLRSKDELVTDLVSRPDDVDKLINKLDDCATDYDSIEFGLPMYNVNIMFKMRMIILEWLKDL